MTFFRITLGILVCLFCYGCGKVDQDGEPKSRLRVAAAADLKFAMDALILRYSETHPDVKVDVTYGSSGNFHGQIQNKAPFDLYFSADVKYPENLRDLGAALDDDVFTYAIGRIVVWVPAASLIDVRQMEIESLLAPSVKKVAVANPDHAPYGVAAVAAMQNLGVYERVKTQFVLGENIAQTAQFIDSGAADIGIIALALALAPQMSEKGNYWEIPTDTFPEMRQGGMILKDTKHPESAKSFRDFILAEEGRAVLKSFGFYLPAAIN